MKVASSFLILALLHHYHVGLATSARDSQFKVNPYTRSLGLMPVDVSHRATNMLERSRSTSRYHLLQPNAKFSIVVEGRKYLNDTEGEEKEHCRDDVIPSATIGITKRISMTSPELLLSGGGGAVMATSPGGNNTDFKTGTRTSAKAAPNTSEATKNALSKKPSSLKGITTSTRSSNPFNLVDDSGADNAAIYAKKLKVRQECSVNIVGFFVLQSHWFFLQNSVASPVFRIVTNSISNGKLYMLRLVSSLQRLTS